MSRFLPRIGTFTATTIRQKRQSLRRMTNGLSLQDAYNTTLDPIRQQGETQIKAWNGGPAVGGAEFCAGGRAGDGRVYR